MRVLLPVDGSPSSESAVAAFIVHRNWYRETPEVHLLHVHPPIPVGNVQEHIGRETLYRYYREDGAQQLAGAMRLLDAAGIEYTPHIHVGSPAETIVRQAEELDCDLIHMGSHGRDWVSSTILGSVASKVLQMTHRPVLLAR